METFRDLALADYENWEDKDKVLVQDDFNRLVANGCDFSEMFQNYSLLMRDSPDEWLETCEIYKKPRLDFDEYLTLKYIFQNAETVIICKGCSLLITGKPYFTCDECFFDFSNGRCYNLCCDCYRAKNFKDHDHRVFSCIHSMTHRSRMQLALNRKMRGSDEERRDEFIDGALIDFGKHFMELAESLTSDPDGWKRRFSKLFGKMSDTEEEDDDSSMSKAKPRNRFVVDLLGLTPTDDTSMMIRNN